MNWVNQLSANIFYRDFLSAPLQSSAPTSHLSLSFYLVHARSRAEIKSISEHLLEDTLFAEQKNLHLRLKLWFFQFQWDEQERESGVCGVGGVGGKVGLYERLKKIILLRNIMDCLLFVIRNTIVNYEGGFGVRVRSICTKLKTTYQKSTRAQTFKCLDGKTHAKHHHRLN